MRYCRLFSDCWGIGICGCRAERVGERRRAKGASAVETVQGGQDSIHSLLVRWSSRILHLLHGFSCMMAGW